MTRRRTALLLFGSLTVVYVVASIVTLAVVRDQLNDRVDNDLTTTVETVAELLNASDLSDVRLEVNQRALLIIDGRDEVDFIAAGSGAAPLPRPDVSASAIIARAGTPFQVSSVDGDVDYRVLTMRLDDGRFLAMAQPLDAVQSTLRTLSILLLITLFAVVAASGLAFWTILRASLRPYASMIATAEAISDGDLERRVTDELEDPNLRRLADSVNTMLDRIESSFDDKEAAENRLRQFVADASHELRTPLTSIHGYSELYLSGAATTSSDVDKQMTRINDEAGRLSRLVDDLLTLARLDEQRPTTLDKVDLGALTRSAVADHVAAHPDASVHRDASADSASIVTGDRDALHQVLINLLSNTYHHTPAGTSVHVSSGVDAATGWFRVSDEGAGMDANTRERVFDRFYRAGTSSGRDRSGTGLGLSIAAAIVAAHDGTISIDTRLGEGTSFTIRIPVQAQRGLAGESSHLDSWVAGSRPINPLS